MAQKNRKENMKKPDSKHNQWENTTNNNKHHPWTVKCNWKRLQDGQEAWEGGGVFQKKKKKKRSFGAIAHSNAEFSRFAHDDAVFTA